jgi:hypothetical protein
MFKYLWRLIFPRPYKAHTILPYEYKWYNFKEKIMELPLTKQHEVELGDYLVIWLNTSDRFNKLEVTGRIIDKDKFLVKIEDRGYVDTEFS